MSCDNTNEYFCTYDSVNHARYFRYSKSHRNMIELKECYFSAEQKRIYNRKISCFEISYNLDNA